MAFVNWGPHYSVGIPLMDTEHKRIADILNKLQTGVRDGVEFKRLKQLFDAVLSVTLEHFESEERIMEGIAFPGVEKHKDEHRQLAAKLTEFIARLEVEQRLSPADAQLFFRGWFLDHIQKHDRDYGVFLYNQRAKLRADVVAPAKDKTKEPVV